jgi:hypothetical protein
MELNDEIILEDISRLNEVNPILTVPKYMIYVHIENQLKGMNRLYKCSIMY